MHAVLGTHANLLQGHVRRVHRSYDWAPVTSYINSFDPEMTSSLWFEGDQADTVPKLLTGCSGCRKAWDGMMVVWV